MQVDIRGRPAAVTVLSLIAFAISPTFLILLGFYFCTIFAESILPSPKDDLGGFLWLCLWLPVAAGCFLILSWITFTAGLDLWRLKDRGRRLAYISMIPFLIVGIGFLLSSDNRWRGAGIALSLFSGFFLVYLQRPAITRIFTRQADPCR